MVGWGGSEELKIKIDNDIYIYYYYIYSKLSLAGCLGMNPILVDT